MITARVIGIGSPYGADRLGWEVIDLLQSLNQLPASCELVKLDRPGTELLAYLEQDMKTVIVDAIQGSSRDGGVVMLGKNDLPAVRSALSSHGIGLAEALRLAETLDQLPDNLNIVGLDVGKDPERLPSADQVAALADSVSKLLN